MGHSPSLLNTLNLTEEQLTAYLNQHPPGPSDERSNRKFPRFAYRMEDGIVLELLSSSSPDECSRVAPRDLSVGGIGFLHRGALPGGTPVAIELRNKSSHPTRVTGRVVQCFGLTSDTYDIGVAFDQPIDINPFMAVGKRSK
ncbi:MAG: PilZ domain-containing protein [Phycisphaerales bacterium]|nr:PilZ domain-containing protein [Phycisphaerales bacterium]